MNVVFVLLCTLVPYLIGSVNTSLIAGKITGKADIRTKGSGNAGMTNVLRNYGKKMAAVVFVGDGLKGVVAVLLVRLCQNDLSSPAMYIAAVFVVIGHIFPIFFGFKGGKGVATSVCSLIALPNGWIIFIILMTIVVALLAITKIMSLSVLITAFTYTFWVLLLNRGMEGLIYNIIFAIIITVILFLTHHANIARLINGTESKLGNKRAE